MAYTQADLVQIDAEITGAEQSLQFADQNGSRAVTKRPLSELLRIRAIIEADLESQKSGVRRSGMIRPIFL